MKLTLGIYRIVPLLLSASGVAALFLPFGAIPADFLGMLYPSLIELGRPSFSWWGIAIVSPLFLPIPIVIWQVRRLLVPRASTGEIMFVYALSSMAMLLTLIGSFVFLDSIVSPPYWANSYSDIFLYVILFCAPCWLLVGGNLWVLARNVKLHVDQGVAAEVFLLGSYLPSAIVPVMKQGAVGIQFVIEHGAVGIRALMMGWWLTTFTCIGYIFYAALLLRRTASNNPAPPLANGG